MWFLKDRSTSKLMPRLRTCEEGVMVAPRKKREVEETLARCWWVPIRRYSVLEVLTERRLEISQV